MATVEENNGVVLSKQDLTGDFAGLSFTLKQYTNLDAAREDLGDELVLDLVNSEVASKMRTKAKNSVVDPSDKGADKDTLVAKAKESAPVRITADEAREFKPGQREVSAHALAREAAKLKREGQEEKAKELYERAVRKMTKELEVLGV